MTRTRRVLLAIVVIFIIYAIVVSPGRSADVAGDGVDVITNAVQNIFTFFDELLDR